MDCSWFMKNTFLNKAFTDSATSSGLIIVFFTDYHMRTNTLSVVHFLSLTDTNTQLQINADIPWNK